MRIRDQLEASPILRSGLLLVSGVVLGALLVFGLHSGGKSQPGASVDTEPKAQAQDRIAAQDPEGSSSETEPACFVGALVPREAADVAAETEGILETLGVRVGDRVQAGEALASLDTHALNHRLAIEEANLKSAEAERKKQSIEVERSAQEQQRRLALSGLVSREEGEAAGFRASSAEAGLEAADAQAAQVRAKIAELKDALSRSVLRAPFTGLISRRYLDPGSRTVVGTPVVRLVRLDDLLVRFAVPLGVAEALSPGTPVRAELVNEGSAWLGTVEQIAPEIDSASLLVFVEARLETADRDSGSLVFGTEARVSLSAGPGQAPPRCLPPQRD